ncbi:transcription initiation factor IIF subunit alpha-like isoform X2 [Aristolochia californica]|uniref:transcription initiation factor IIF subunit alpha-like isoform X2 n=1 Tax=Aristolochia californica TaxID=171875 RepID=UPI0035DBDA79
MSFDLLLKLSCGECGSTIDLYGSNCKHLTLCLSCGKKMTESHSKCYDCGAPITRLIREYNVRAITSNDKTYSIARFTAGLPNFSKKKSAENKWSLHKEGLQGRQMIDGLREKYKNKPWVLEDETGQSQYQGHLEGSQSANYYLLMMQGKEFVAMPAGSWYNFNKEAQYKQLTLEEAEEKMKNRRRTADGYQRWMMKAANNGPAAFGEVEKIDLGKERTEGGSRKKVDLDDDEAPTSDRGEEDEEEEQTRKNRLDLNKKNVNDDEEGPRGGDHDLDDDDIEKGDDWEHEEKFTDDDEAVGNDLEEREDLAPEVPAPPEIKQDDEDEEDDNEEGTKLSKSGKELKKLLGKAAGLNESDAEDDEDDDDDLDDEIGLSPVLAPKSKQKDAPKEEPVESSPSKPSATPRGTPSQPKSAKTKRKASGEDVKPSSTPAKKLKSEHPSSVKEEPSSTSKKGAPPKGSLCSKSGSTLSPAPVTEEEIRAVLLQKAPVTTQDLVAKFKARLRTPEDKSGFAEILKRISKIQKTNGPNYVVLREK